VKEGIERVKEPERRGSGQGNFAPELHHSFHSLHRVKRGEWDPGKDREGKESGRQIVIFLTSFHPLRQCTERPLKLQFSSN